jgi:DNA-binding MarR family transcriptional regulator
MNRLSISAVTRRLKEPDSTVLRWISKLEELELVTRTPSLHDGRIIYLALTEAGLHLVDEYFLFLQGGDIIA